MFRVGDRVALTINGAFWCVHFKNAPRPGDIGTIDKLPWRGGAYGVKFPLRNLFLFSNQIVYPNQSIYVDEMVVDEKTQVVYRVGDRVECVKTPYVVPLGRRGYVTRIKDCESDINSTDLGVRWDGKDTNFGTCFADIRHVR